MPRLNNNGHTATNKGADNMSRESNDHYDGETGRLIQGYDYTNQAWVFEGLYETCGHPQDMACDCYGRAHAGEETKPGRLDG